VKRLVTGFVIKATGGGIDKKYEFLRILEGSYGRKKRARAVPEEAFCQSPQGIQ
jgi:hypothetical protein